MHSLFFKSGQGDHQAEQPNPPLPQNRSLISMAASKDTGMLQWLKGQNTNSQEVLHNGVTVLMCGAAAHAVYLAAAPEPLRVPIAVRNAALWKRVSLGALCVVAAYDGWQARRLALESGAAAAKAKELTSQLLAASE